MLFRSLWARAAAGPVLLNTAMSKGGPWTTGRINITNTAAVPMTETFTLTGKDARTANGGGTIQLVSGSVSTRATTGPNSNRGWVELQLIPAEAVPATQWWGLAAIAALIALSFGYAMRQRLFARG